MFDSQISSRPDWLIMGCQWERTDDGPQVMVLASRKLVDGTLRSETDNIYIADDVFPPTGITRHFIEAEMTEFVIVVAKDYPTALSKLMETWTPEPERSRPPAQIDRAQLELEAGLVPPRSGPRTENIDPGDLL